MKKTLSVLLALASVFSLQAKPVDQQTGKTVAYNFLHTAADVQAINSADDLQLVYEGVKDPATGIACFYVFNTNKTGFVIVSADDIAYPVLGYSGEGNFSASAIPANVGFLLNGFRETIAGGIDNHLAATPATTAMWIELTRNNSQRKTTKVTGVAVVKPLIKTSWNQSPYYNIFCPMDNSTTPAQQSVTGCVATSMAQIMKFWNYPATGVGAHTYSSPYGSLTANFGATTYNWSMMPTLVSGAVNDTAAALLVYHAGVAVNMNYNPSGSGAQVTGGGNSAQHAFATYFKYKNTMQGMDRSSFSTADDWMTALKMELNASRPFIYVGYDPSAGGHAWVIDGFDVNNMLHANWGWGGSYNGYYASDAMDPAIAGNSSGDQFDNYQSALFGIEPAAPSIGMNLYAQVSAPATVSYDHPFAVTSKLTNIGTDTFKGDYAARVFDLTGNPVDSIQVMSAQVLNGSDNTTTLTFATTGSVAMTPGQYVVGIYYRPAGKTWFEAGEAGSYTNLVSMTVVAATTAVPQTTIAGDIKVYPSPATDAIHIESAKLVAGSAIRVQNAEGQVVASALANNTTAVTIPVSNLAAGIYFVQMQTISGVQTRTLMIQK